MKIIEAMKKLRLIEKRLADNATRIQLYSSGISTEIPHFETVEAQKAEVQKLIQENVDLVNTYMELKRQIDYTNIATRVSYGGKIYALSDLLWLKRKLGNALQNTFNALNEQQANTRMRTAHPIAGTPIQILRFYDEKKKHEHLAKIQTMMSELDGRLEVVNSTTELEIYETNTSK